MNDAPDDPPTLHMPEAEADALRTAYRGAARIVEYGSGGSTLFAAAETGADILSIESDPDWARRLRAHLARSGHDRPGVEVRHVDIGPVGPWGTPRSEKAYRKFPGFALAPWGGDQPGPDVVLIDGRFRLACFAATLLNTVRPVTVLWDDYIDRTGYHRAERLAPVSRMVGRMAIFDLAPRQLSPREISEMIPWFSIPA